MDRVTVEQGQVPLETDLLRAGQYAMVGLAKLAQDLLGTSVLVNGFALTATNPASLNLSLGPGTIYSMESLEESAWSSLGAETTDTILKQGIALAADVATPLTFVAPTTLGYAQCFLIEAQYEDEDALPVLRPYFNSDNINVALQGAGGDGQPDNTARRGIVNIQVKAGTAAPSGTQTIPTPDAGFVGLWVVTLAANQTQITSANIAEYSAAPFIPVTLPAVPAAIQAQASNWAEDTSSNPNAMQISLPSYTSLVPGLRVIVQKNGNNTAGVTLSINGGPALPVQWPDGSALASYSTGPDAPNGALLEMCLSSSNVWQLLNIVGPSVFTRQSANQTEQISTGGAFTTSAAYKSYMLNRTSGLAASSTTLPTNPADGDTYWYEDLVGNLNQYPLTVSIANGSAQTVRGGTQIVMQTPFQCGRFKYCAAANAWSFGSLVTL